jgi:heme oxygenase
MTLSVRRIRSLAQIAEVKDLRAVDLYLQEGRRLIGEQRVRQLGLCGQGDVVAKESERLLSNLSESLHALHRFRLLIAQDVAKGPYHDKAAATSPNKNAP